MVSKKSGKSSQLCGLLTLSPSLNIAHVLRLHLQPAAVDNLVVNSQLTALVVDDENPDAATAIVEAVVETGEQAALVEDRQALLNITGLGHGNDAAVIADVKDTVLLEDRAEHVLDNDGGGWVADEGRLLVQLLGEEVDTEVAVLAGLGGSCDTDDLARAALEDQEVANADVVAGNGDGVGHTAALGVARSHAGGGLTGSGNLDVAVADHAVFVTAVLLLVVAGVVVLVLAAVNGVEDAVGSAVQAVTEGVVLAVFVVVSHVTFGLGLRGAWVDGVSLGSTGSCVDVDWIAFGETGLFWVVSWVSALVLPVTGS